MLNFSLSQWQTQNVLGARAKINENSTSFMRGHQHVESHDIFKIKGGISTYVFSQKGTQSCFIYDRDIQKDPFTPSEFLRSDKQEQSFWTQQFK